MPDQFDALCARFFDCTVQRNVSMAQYTSFRTGGCARALVEPRSVEALQNALLAVHEYGIPYEVIGNGTNLLVSDAGIDAVVFHIGESMRAIRQENGLFFAEAGASFSALAKRTVECGFMGLEWAAGIPGSVGGAIAMNAGAYGGEVGETVHRITYMDATSGTLVDEAPAEEMFGYRFSAYRAPDRIARMAEYTAKRREKQPLAYPSAGSTFKRPAGNFAGALIEQAGLKGVRVGGAAVSSLHAGFIINAGGATSTDVYNLIRRVQRDVHAQSGIWLEPEVRLLGSFSNLDEQ